MSFEGIHIKVCLVERGINLVKKAQTAKSEILNSHGVERLPTLINVKMRLVIRRAVSARMQA